MRKFILPCLLVLPALSCLKISFNDDRSQSIRPEQQQKIVPFDLQRAGQPLEVSTAAGITFQEIDAGKIKSTLQLGKKTWVYLWGSWCMPCRKKLPEIARIYRANPDWALLMVAEDYNIALLQQLLFENRVFTQPYLLDKEKYGTKTHLKAQKLREELAPGSAVAEGYPQNYLFDAQGNLLLYKAGSLTPEELARYFNL